jgi:hypothetical protein
MKNNVTRKKQAPILPAKSFLTLLDLFLNTHHDRYYRRDLRLGVEGGENPAGPGGGGAAAVQGAGWQ